VTLARVCVLTLAGATGASGATGRPGSDGFTGPQGLIGNPGRPGFTGPPGPAGNTGESGNAARTCLLTMASFSAVVAREATVVWTTQPSIPPGSVNEYQLRLGRKGRYGSFR